MCLCNATHSYVTLHKKMWKVVFKRNQPITSWAREQGFTIENPNPITQDQKVFDGGISCFETKQEAKAFRKHIKQRRRDWKLTKWTMFRVSVRPLIVSGRVIHGSCNGTPRQQLMAEKFVRWCLFSA